MVLIIKHHYCIEFEVSHLKKKSCDCKKTQNKILLKSYINLEVAVFQYTLLIVY